jgi:hypothetical protein
VLDTASELLGKCIAAGQGGMDFPGVWHSLLKGHPLVVGVPEQRMRGEQTVLEIRLITGQRIVLGADGYSLS